MTYGELFLQNEYEMSCYNLDEADVGEQVRTRGERFESRLQHCFFGGGNGQAADVDASDPRPL